MLFQLSDQRCYRDAYLEHIASFRDVPPIAVAERAIVKCVCYVRIRGHARSASGSFWCTQPAARSAASVSGVHAIGQDVCNWLAYNLFSGPAIRAHRGLVPADDVASNVDTDESIGHVGDEVGLVTVHLLRTLAVRDVAQEDLDSGLLVPGGEDRNGLDLLEMAVGELKQHLFGVPNVAELFQGSDPFEQADL